MVVLYLCFEAEKNMKNVSYLKVFIWLYFTIIIKSTLSQTDRMLCIHNKSQKCFGIKTNRNWLNIRFICKITKLILKYILIFILK